MKLSNSSDVPVYTIAGSSTARPLPEWLVRKRKRSLKNDPEFANRIELLQDFEFEEASSCVRVSEDGDWVMSTGTYKPQIHSHYLPHLSLSFARHTNSLNETFVLLSTDYTKSLHLQADRFLEFHTAGGLHYTTRIPRYGRDLKYNKRTAEALVPSVGVNADGNGEVFRLNLEVGRFMKGYEIDVGQDDADTLGHGALQGSVHAGSVNCASIAEESHGLLAFGTSLGTVEFWDSRSRNRVSALGPPRSVLTNDDDSRAAITAIEFHQSGLNLATGTSTGVVHTYDLRSPVPLLRREQGYGFPIKTLKYLQSSSLSSQKIMSADKRLVKIWDAESGDYWTSVEPAVDINHVEWVPDSGMLLTANEGRQQHAFFIPQLGPAPKWCAFLDNLVEEMAEDADDPNAFNSTKTAAGEVYDNYKFLDMKQLRELSLDHLVGQTSLLRPYMHGYFVAQKLYEQARLLINPDLAQEQRQKSIQEKINKERESRIRGNKKIAVKVNRRLAERLAAREEAHERRKAQRVLRRGGDDGTEAKAVENASEDRPAKGLMADSRFTKLFEDEDFEVDETSREFALQNPSSIPNANGDTKRRGYTAVEEDEMDDRRGSSDDDDFDDDDSDSENEDDDGADAKAEAAALRARQRKSRFEDDSNDNSSKRIGTSSYQKANRGKPNKFSAPSASRMQVSSSGAAAKRQRERQKQSFGDLAASLSSRDQPSSGGRNTGGEVVGSKEVTFAPAKPPKKGPRRDDAATESNGRHNDQGGARPKDRRSASGNVFRRM